MSESKTIKEVKQEPLNEFEKSILDIQNQLTAIRELPLQIQNHISLLEKQLSDLLSHKIKPTETNDGDVDNEGKQNEDFDVRPGDNVGDETQEADDDNDDVFEMDIDETFEVIDDEQELLEAIEDTLKANSDGEAEEKEPRSRPMYPLTPLPRPIVLPGGRKWRGPKDAYNEKFIAETLISQAEVLVGSTLG